MEIEDGVASFPNGLKLRLTPAEISKQLVWDATRRHPDPEPPRVWIKDRGEYETNPDDPDYRRGLELAKERRAFAAIKAMIVLGTELVEAPAGLPGPEDVDWDKFAAVRDLPPPANRYDRYDTWLRYYAFGYQADAAAGLREYTSLSQHLALVSGLTMEGPSSVVATFRDDEGRGADQPGDAVAPADDGAGGRAAPAGGPGR